MRSQRIKKNTKNNNYIYLNNSIVNEVNSRF